MNAEEQTRAYKPPLIAVCSYPEGDHIHWPIDSVEEGGHCLMECECKPLIYVLHSKNPRKEKP